MSTHDTVADITSEETVEVVRFSTRESELDNDTSEAIAMLCRHAGETLSLADAIRRRNARRNGVTLREAA